MNPKDNMSLTFLQYYRLFMWNNHIPQALPCIKIKRIVAKMYEKDQQPLKKHII